MPKVLLHRVVNRHFDTLLLPVHYVPYLFFSNVVVIVLASTYTQFRLNLSVR